MVFHPLFTSKPRKNFSVSHGRLLSALAKNLVFSSKHAISLGDIYKKLLDGGRATKTETKILVKWNSNFPSILLGWKKWSTSEGRLFRDKWTTFRAILNPDYLRIPCAFWLDWKFRLNVKRPLVLACAVGKIISAISSRR